MRFFIIALTLLVLGLISKLASASDFHIIDLDKADMVGAKFLCNREPMTPQYACEAYKGRVAIDLNVRILEYGYWNNYVHTEGLPSAVKTVGWHWELGLHLAPGVDVFEEHHSRHVMEEEQPKWYDNRNNEIVNKKFPVEDSVGIRFTFYINPTPSRTLVPGR